MKKIVTKIYNLSYQNKLTNERKKSIAVGLLLLQIFIFIASLFLVNNIKAQRTVISNNGYIVINSGAFYVIDNSNTNAITVNSGGNIKTEGENNIVKWNIGTNTGIFTVPFTTKNNVKIPLILNLFTAGAGTGHFLFSTFTDIDAINSWNNQDYMPSMVTNMFGVNGSFNNSDHVIDRFWRIEHSAYLTLAPSAVFEVGYDDNERSALGNLIPLGALIAQFYNSTQNEWSYVLSGSDNPGISVQNIIPDSTFFPIWTLTDLNNPLPVGMLNFTAVEEGGNSVLLKWSTASEVNNDYFIIEKSKNTINWETVGTIQGAGNNTFTLDYVDYDLTPYFGLSYYRIKQVDFDGKSTYSQIETVLFENNKFLFYPNPVPRGENIHIRFSANKKGIANVLILDDKGSLISTEDFNFNKGWNEVEVLSPNAFGCYIVKMSSLNNTTVNKVIPFIVN